MNNSLPIKLELSESFFDEEVRNGFKVTSDIKELWAIEMDLLAELDTVCRKYGLKYFMDAGSLLGAIRHKGFIPWDDDIDLIMLRDDYEKLNGVAEKEFKHPYFYQTEFTDPGSLRSHAQLRNSLTTGILTAEKEKGYKFNQGIFIDIFPMDYIPDNLLEREKYMNTARELWYATLRNEIKTRKYEEDEKGLIKYYHSLTHMLSGSKKQQPNECFDRFEKYIIERSKIKTDYVTKIKFHLMSNSMILKTEWLENVTYVPFESMTVPVPEKYEEVLCTYFGPNWHTPLNTGTMHGGMIIDVRKPYTEYLK